MPVQRRRRQTGALCERAPLLAHLRSGYALPTSRQRRHILILIAARFSPQIPAPRGGHYWTRKGVTIGSDLTVNLSKTPVEVGDVVGSHLDTSR